MTLNWTGNLKAHPLALILKPEEVLKALSFTIHLDNLLPEAPHQAYILANT